MLELYSISIQAVTQNQVEQLYQRLTSALKNLRHRASNILIKTKEGSKYTHLVCEVMLPKFQFRKHSFEVNAATAEALAEYIIEEVETGLVHTIIERKIGRQNHDEISKIENYCYPLLSGEHPDHFLGNGRRQRITNVANCCREYLEQHNHIALEGFVRFRLKAYVDELKEVVEYAIDESIMEKQYQEFISLLQYFVYIQESKIPMAHLMHQGGQEFLVLDAEMKPIEMEQADGLVVEMMDKEMNVEDMIISTLITMSPQRVFIHTREPEAQVIQTIQQIFEDRTQVCTDCALCAPVLDKSQENNQLYT